MATASGKNNVTLLLPTVTQFVSPDNISVQELPIKSIPELEIPMGKDVSIQQLTTLCLCNIIMVSLVNYQGMSSQQHLNL